MKNSRKKFTAVCLAIGLALSGKVRAADEHDHTQPSAPVTGAAAPAPAPANTVRMADILREALEKNPSLRSVRLKQEASGHRASAAGGIADLEFKHEWWAVPIKKPLSLDKADTLMFGLRQAFPAWGARDARRKTAEASAAMSGEMVRDMTLDIAMQVRSAFADYYRAWREREVHEQHIELMQSLIAVARANYSAGRIRQEDVLALSSELSRTHGELIMIRQELRSMKARINALRGLPPDTELGTPELTNVPQADKQSAASPENRPSVEAARRAVVMAEAMQEEARSESLYPMVMVGADYWYMPMAMERHTYGTMISMSLPWLNSKNREMQHASESELAAERLNLETAELEARRDAENAKAEVDAATESLEVVTTNLLPETRQRLEATRSSFSSGTSDALRLLDALRAWLEIQIERDRAAARLEMARADLDRATGTLPDTQTTVIPAQEIRHD